MSALEQVQSAVNSEDFGQSSCGSKPALRTEYSSNVLTEYEDFEDGHKPGNTKEKTRLAINKGKQSVKFLALFDALLEPIWCERAYDYALSRNGKPFGIYVRTDEALNGSIDAEQIWQSGDKQRALALVTTRALVFNRARPMLQNDITAIHGTAVWCLASGESNSVQVHSAHRFALRCIVCLLLHLHPRLTLGTLPLERMPICLSLSITSITLNYIATKPT